MSADPPSERPASAVRGDTRPIADAGLTRDAFLGDALTLLQPERGYRAGIDAVLLAAAVSGAAGAAAASTPIKALDLGAGIGTAGLCLARRLRGAEVVLLERQPALAALARRNVAANGLAGRVTVVEADLLAPQAVLAAAGLAIATHDVVLANPPYHAEGHGTASGDAVKAAANAMAPGMLDHWARAMARLCRPGGEAIMIHKAEALADVLTVLGRRFGALDVLPIHPRRGEPAIRVLVRGSLASRAPSRLLAGFVLHAETGGFTPAAEAILRHAAPLEWPCRRRRAG